MNLKKKTGGYKGNRSQYVPGTKVATPAPAPVLIVPAPAPVLSKVLIIIVKSEPHERPCGMHISYKNCICESNRQLYAAMISSLIGLAKLSIMMLHLN